MSEKHYINLTNGIEFLDQLDHRTACFIRIQSTHCEQKRYEDIIMSLSDDLLMHLALGFDCVIHDASHHGEPRALWQGVAFIKMLVRLLWFNKKTILPNGMHADFAKRIKELSDRALNRIKYYRKFLYCNDISIKCVSIETRHDGKYNIFRHKISRYMPVKEPTNEK
jgi:hypothetical protein